MEPPAPDRSEADRVNKPKISKEPQSPTAGPSVLVVTATEATQQRLFGFDDSKPVTDFWQNELKSPSSTPESSNSVGEQSEKLKQVPQIILSARSAQSHFESRELFQPAPKTINDDDDAKLREVLSAGVVLDLARPAIEKLLKEGNQYLTLSLPDDKGGVVELDLVKVDLFAPGFKVETSTPTGEVASESLGTHYRGIVKGDYHSLAAISVFPNEVMGFYSTETGGNHVLGRLGGNNPTDKHILYAERDLKVSSTFHCDTAPDEVTLPEPPSQTSDDVASTCVRIYLEANFDLFQNKGSVASTTSYITGFFNQSAALYSNEGIPISISEIFVWTSPSPYTGIDSKQQLEKFQAFRTTFNGNLAHLLTLQSGFGGIAYRPGLCSSFAYGFSAIDPNFYNVPTYSWTVEVFTHETGHNLGSSHTHACVWNGNNTAIDGCYTPEGSCARLGLPPSGGTIMSYCHLTSAGINFTFGFGSQPHNVIANAFNNAPCLSTCGTTCTYALSPSTQSFGSSGGNGSFTVTTAQSCSWSALSNASWITTTSSGTGSGTVSYVVTGNTGSARTGSITVGSQNFTVTQSAGGGACPSTPISFDQIINGTLSTSDCVFTGTTRYVDVYNFSGNAGQRIAVEMSSGTFDTYLNLLNSGNQIIAQDDDGGGGTNSRIPGGSGFFTLPATGTYTIYATSFSADGNTGSTGTYSIKLIAAVTCNYALSPNSGSFGPAGGSNSFSVATSDTCGWSAVSNAAWITTASSGTGAGTVSYSVASNSGAARTGTITVAGQSFTITQSAGSGGCPATTISAGQIVGGSLTTSDCFFTGTTRYVDVYGFNGTAGQQVVVSMGSSTFDTYLYLLNSANQLIAQDDDGGGGTNSRVPTASGFFTLPTTGTYTIYATAYSADGMVGGTGAYTISLSGSNRAKTVGVFRPSNGIVYLKNANSGGVADLNFVYGVAGDQPIAGDWDGNGVDTLGIYRNGTFYLRNSNTTGPANIVFAFGASGDQPIAGDWNGDGTDTIGVYRPSTGVFYLRNSNSAGPADLSFVLGNPGDVGIAGDWNGDGVTTTGVFRPSNGIVYLKNANTSGNADISLVYGNAGDLPLAGDWNADSVFSPGIYRDGVFYLRNSNTQGFADLVFAMGNNGDVPLAGDWDGLP
ncbi:MAG TPA: M12 family metallo-peptidase [Pyrinomonadaceae bacterium]